MGMGVGVEVGLGLVNSITNLQMKLAHLHSLPDRRSSAANLAIKSLKFQAQLCAKVCNKFVLVPKCNG